MSAVTVLYIWVLLYSFHHSLTGPCDRPGRTKRGTLRQFIVLTRAPHAVRCQTRGPLAKCGPPSHLVWPAGGSEAFSWLITKSTLLHYVQLQLQQWMSLLKRHVWCVQGSAASPHQLHPGSWSSELRYLGGFFGQLFCVNSLAPQCDDSDSRKLLNLDLDVWLWSVL